MLYFVIGTLLLGACVGLEDVTIISTTAHVDDFDMETTTGAVTPIDEEIATTTEFSLDVPTTRPDEIEDSGATLIPRPGGDPRLRMMPVPGPSDFVPLSTSSRPSHVIPFGVLHNADGSSAKKRCRCIEKKRRKVVKEIKYLPLVPVITLEGQQRNFTCKCSHLRKIPKM